ncbi:hypothetical protein [Massilia sp. WF1]|uniref:hypothetical protein n=1 Tax=Massilia sp. WF1 TaxID=1406431 RepID=UPI00068A3428|nr:hypothetical protein [Massilia sp. WF1]
MKSRQHRPACLVLSVFIAAAPAFAAQPKAGASAELAVLETTDLHSAVVGYDYFKLADDPSMGLDRTASLIAQARRDFPNTLLFDNGDTIQGNALGDYQATVDPLPCGQLLGIYKAMRKIGYDGIGIGNHDFNFGLAYLAQVTGQRLDGGGDVQKKQCAGRASGWSGQTFYAPVRTRPLFGALPHPQAAIRRRMPHGGPSRRAFRVAIIASRQTGHPDWDALR